MAAHNAADGILFILVSVFFWYLASRLAHRFVAQIARHQTARKSAVKFGGLLAGAFIMLAFLLAWRVTISPLLPITILTVIGCLSFWAEATLAQRWKLQNEL